MLLTDVLAQSGDTLHKCDPMSVERWYSITDVVPALYRHWVGGIAQVGNAELHVFANWTPPGQTRHVLYTIH